MIESRAPPNRSSARYLEEVGSIESPLRRCFSQVWPRPRLFSTLPHSTVPANTRHPLLVTVANGNAGVATPTPTFPGFPGGVTSGLYNSPVFDLTLASSCRAGFITTTVSAAEAMLIAGIAAGNAYLNIHSTNFPGGEIRGFLAEAPEPGEVVKS